jgi:hypothetical protein
VPDMASQHSRYRLAASVMVTPVCEHKLALVIGAPQIVGRLGLFQARALSLIARAVAASTDEAMAVQHRMDGAVGRQADLAVQPSELLADLRLTPARMLSPQLNNERRADDAGSRRNGGPVRSCVGHPLADFEYAGPNRARDQCRVYSTVESARPQSI